MSTYISRHQMSWKFSHHHSLVKSLFFLHICMCAVKESEVARENHQQSCKQVSERGKWSQDSQFSLSWQDTLVTAPPTFTSVPQVNGFPGVKNLLGNLALFQAKQNFSKKSHSLYNFVLSPVSRCEICMGGHLERDIAPTTCRSSIET